MPANKAGTDDEHINFEHSVSPTYSCELKRQTPFGGNRIMSRRILKIYFGVFFTLSIWALIPAGQVNAANPCAAKNPCNPCAAKNPCAAGNPCNPCAAGGASAGLEGVMVSGKVTGYKGKYMKVRTSSGKTVSVHLQKWTTARLGSKAVNPKTLKAGMSVNISTQTKGSYHKANFIWAVAGGGGGNPCGGNPFAANPCAGRNPCAVKNPCTGHNPCAAKNPCNPCAGRKQSIRIE